MLSYSYSLGDNLWYHHMWRNPLLFFPFFFCPSYPTGGLLAGSKAFPTSSEALPANSEALPASSEAVHAASEALIAASEDLFETLSPLITIIVSDGATAQLSLN